MPPPSPPFHSDAHQLRVGLPALQRPSAQRLLSHAVRRRMHGTQRLRLSGKWHIFFSDLSFREFARFQSQSRSVFRRLPPQACRHFNDSGVCKDNCPPPTIYDPATFQTKPNPDKKFNFGATCVKTCPCEERRIREASRLSPPPPLTNDPPRR